MLNGKQLLAMWLGVVVEIGVVLCPPWVPPYGARSDRGTLLAWVWSRPVVATSMSKVEQDVEAKEIQQQLEDEIADARASDEHARCDEEADLARGGEVAALVMDYRKFKQEHPEKAWWSDSDQVAYRAAAIRRSHEQERVTIGASDPEH